MRAACRSRGLGEGMKNETVPLLKSGLRDDSSDATSTRNYSNNQANKSAAANANGPSTLYEISVHRSRKRTLEKGFDARGSFVHFAHRSLKSVIQVQDVLDRPGVRSFLYRAKWFRRPSMVRLRSFMTGTFVTVCSFASLLIALFCSDVYAFLGAGGLVKSRSLQNPANP